MLESAWSEPQSDVTEELGIAMFQAGDGGAAVTRNPLQFCHHLANDDAAPRQRCVMPKAQPSSLNGSDQRVPVYRDQTVPVWEGGGGAASTAAKRKAASASRTLQGRDSRRFGGGGADSSSDTASSGEYCACSGRDGGSWRGGGGVGDGGASSASSEVSFDAILSMYESSLGEKSLRRDGRVLFATVFKPHHDTFRRRRTFAGRGLISVQLSPFRALMGEAGVDHESVRRLRVAIEQTTICDPPSATCGSGLVRLRIVDPIVHRSCDFQSPYLRRDPLSLCVTTAMLTTSSS